jgi:hypothetical protein
MSVGMVSRERDAVLAVLTCSDVSKFALMGF